MHAKKICIVCACVSLTVRSPTYWYGPGWGYPCTPTSTILFLLDELSSWDDVVSDCFPNGKSIKVVWFRHRKKYLLLRLDAALKKNIGNSGREEYAIFDTSPFLILFLTGFLQPARSTSGPTYPLQL